MCFTPLLQCFEGHLVLNVLRTLSKVMKVYHRKEQPGTYISKKKIVTTLKKSQLSKIFHRISESLWASGNQDLVALPLIKKKLFQ